MQIVVNSSKLSNKYDGYIFSDSLVTSDGVSFFVIFSQMGFNNIFQW